MTLNKIEKHIIELKTRNRKRRIKIKFPIVASPELASVIGHCIGDGSLTERQFSFFNQSRELVDEVTANVNAAFSTNIIPKEFKKSGGWEIEFPTNIARLISLAGGPLGEKVFLPFRVPEWVMNGSKEIKIAFIRAVFDDEGWIKIKFIRPSSSTQRMIGINMSKCAKFINNHVRFLEDVRKMLLELGIRPSKVVEMGKTVNGINLGFTISNLKNLKKFLSVISFTNLTKRKQLIGCLEESKRFDQLFPGFIQRYKD
ncbi:MAG: LAGLIDADG family homing endonuclease [Candidatus Aenigmarchaeota archaeon]|nr:LAGLIDADG family homing endonuclease [Candidatus Aenigmarchaeota archaeon]